MSCCFDKSQNDGHQWSHDRANSGIWCSTLLWAVCHFTAAVHRFFVISWALKMHTMEHLRRFSKISQFKWWELSTFEDIFSFGDKSFCLYFSFSFFLYIGVKPSPFKQGYVPQGLVSRIRLDFYLNCHLGSYKSFGCRYDNKKRTLF